MVTIDGKPLTKDYTGELWRFKLSYEDMTLIIKDDSKPYRIKDESISLVLQGADTYNTRYYSTRDLCATEYMKAKLKRSREVIRSLRDVVSDEADKLAKAASEAFALEDGKDAKQINFMLDCFAEMGAIQTSIDNLVKSINKTVR